MQGTRKPPSIAQDSVVPSSRRDDRAEPDDNPSGRVEVVNVDSARGEGAANSMGSLRVQLAKLHQQAAAVERSLEEQRRDRNDAVERLDRAEAEILSLKRVNEATVAELQRVRAERDDLSLAVEAAKAATADVVRIKEDAEDQRARADEGARTIAKLETDLVEVKKRQFQESLRATDKAHELEALKGKVSKADAETAKARDEAERAGGDLESARTLADRARTDADEAKAEAARARTDADEAKAEAARARTDADEAKRASDETSAALAKAREDLAKARDDNLRDRATARDHIDEIERTLEDARTATSRAEAATELANAERDAAVRRAEAERAEARGVAERSAQDLTAALAAAADATERARAATLARTAMEEAVRRMRDDIAAAFARVDVPQVVDVAGAPPPEPVGGEPARAASVAPQASSVAAASVAPQANSVAAASVAPQANSVAAASVAPQASSVAPRASVAASTDDASSTPPLSTPPASAAPAVTRAETKPAGPSDAAADEVREVRAPMGPPPLPVLGGHGPPPLPTRAGEPAIISIPPEMVESLPPDASMSLMPPTVVAVVHTLDTGWSSPPGALDEESSSTADAMAPPPEKSSVVPIAGAAPPDPESFANLLDDEEAPTYASVPPQVHDSSVPEVTELPSRAPRPSTTDLRTPMPPPPPPPGSMRPVAPHEGLRSLKHDSKHPRLTIPRPGGRDSAAPPPTRRGSGLPESGESRRETLLTQLGDPVRARSAASELREFPEWLFGAPGATLVSSLATLDYDAEGPLFDLARAWEREPLCRALVVSLRTESDARVREHTAWLLKHLAAPAHWKTLAEIATNDDEPTQLRRWLLEALDRLAAGRHVGWKELGDTITRLAHHADATLRDGVVGILVSLDKSDDKRRLLLDILREDDDEVVIASAVHGLSSVLPIELDPSVVERLLGHPSPRVQRSVRDLIERARGSKN